MTLKQWGGTVQHVTPSGKEKGKEAKEPEPEIELMTKLERENDT